LRRLVTLLGVLATFTTVAACNPNTPAVPELTDPHQILARTIEATAGLKTLRFRVDLDIRDQARPGVPLGGSAEGVLDLSAGEMNVTAVASDGSGGFAYIQAEGATFTRTSANGRWSQFPAVPGMAALFLMGGLGGDQPDPRKILVDLLDDAETGVSLHGVEDCQTGRCYRTTVTLPPAQVWKVFAGITGINDMRGGAQVEPPLNQIPAIALEVLSDTATLRLVGLAASMKMNGSTAALRVQVGAPNEPVSIEPPPPGLVDKGFPGVGIGGGVAPAQPVPVQRDPAQTDGP
jgi:hypothetical protein